jgi:hypothetical protein
MERRKATAIRANVFEVAMSSLGPFLVVVPLLIATVSGIVVVYYREVMLAELEGQIDESERMRFPRLSFYYSNILRLHGKYNPGSRIARRSRVARIIVIACAVFMMATFLIAVIINSR